MELVQLNYKINNPWPS